MRHSDFARLTPQEWVAVMEAKAKETEAAERREWERLRVGATIGVQPHCRKALKAEDVLPLPWDKEKAAPAPPISRDEARARYERRMAMLHPQKPGSS